MFTLDITSYSTVHVYILYSAIARRRSTEKDLSLITLERKVFSGPYTIGIFSMQYMTRTRPHKPTLWTLNRLAAIYSDIIIMLNY